MSDTPIDTSWWLASDGKWYPPTLAHLAAASGLDLPAPTGAAVGPDLPPPLPEPPTLPPVAMETATALMELPREFHLIHGFGRGHRDYEVNHLVIGPTGIFVIISSGIGGKLVKQGGTLWSGDRSISPEVEQVEALARFAHRILGFDVDPVLCFVQATLPRREQTVGRVRVVEVGALAHHLRSGRASLKPGEVDAAVERVDEWLRQAPGAALRPVARPPSLKRRLAVGALGLAAAATTAALGASMITDVSVASTDSKRPTITSTTTIPNFQVLTIDWSCRPGQGYQLIPRPVSTGLSVLQVSATVGGQAMFLGPVAAGQPGPPIMGVPRATAVGFDYLVVDSDGQPGPSTHLDFVTPDLPC